VKKWRRKRHEVWNINQQSIVWPEKIDHHHQLQGRPTSEVIFPTLSRSSNVLMFCWFIF
jgi:hypothetical protein